MNEGMMIFFLPDLAYTLQNNGNNCQKATARSDKTTRTGVDTLFRLTAPDCLKLSSLSSAYRHGRSPTNDVMLLILSMPTCS